MDTNRIKKFATEARNILKRGIAAKITTLGFDGRGIVPENQMPQLMQGGTLWNGQLETESFYHQWMSLYQRVQTKGISEVYEEAAYTWFNRLMAIRILQKNGLCEPVMEYADASRTPRIVNEARMGNLPQMPEEVRHRLVELLDDDTKVTEQFAVLVTAWCHQNPIIQNCFGGIKDYTELLLPRDILSEGGFVDMINHSEFITDEDYISAELIGWLYQFYISERKDEVFAKKGKFKADEIPAATQIFTPNWIVKYMVQNTVGRIYLDNNPYAEELFKPQWKYLVDSAEPTPVEAIYHYDELTDLKVADLACGSGHILNECFDLLYDLYISEAYSRSEAIENIFKCNLTGIDLDNRAKQMAQFALLIKACQKDNRFADAHCMPNVLTMPEKRDENSSTSVADLLHQITLGADTPQMAEEIQACYELMQDADSLGSIMKFSIGDTTRLMLKQTVEYWEQETVVPAVVEEEMPRLKLILALTEKYSALVMNPPYMGGSNMNQTLTKYVKTHYNKGKADLMTVFIVLAEQKTLVNGKYAMITLPSWLFLSTFENLRESMLAEDHIDSLLHMGRGVFGIDWGSVAFVNSKSYLRTKGVYFRLHERNFQHIYFRHIGQLFLKVLLDHSFTYDFKTYRDEDVSDTDILDIQSSSNGQRLYFECTQEDFKKIPGSPIAYWVSQNVLSLFATVSPLSSFADTKSGMATTDNTRFLRYWFEVDNKRICYNCNDIKETKHINSKWFPYNKGGDYRKWYGNRNYVVNWYNDGQEIRKAAEGASGGRLVNIDMAFKECITWSSISAGDISLRYCEGGFMFDSKGSCCFTDNLMYYIQGFLNTCVAKSFLRLLCPTIDYTPGKISLLPIKIDTELSNDIENTVKDCINISKLDWNSHEVSWDFQTNELLRIRNKGLGDIICKIEDQEVLKYTSLEMLMIAYKTYWQTNFYQLQNKEEYLNQKFINNYGLSDELNSKVPLETISILQKGEISFLDNKLIWHEDVIVKQLISYSVGVWMGRYRLDKPGLHIAHPQPTDDEMAPYTFNSEKVYIDEDAIVPILPSGCPFDDNLVSRVVDFVRIVFGEENLTENLNFMEQLLGMTIEQYLIKDFWKDHKKMYQNRPIYWLFSSKKGAFKCLTYMHRMTPYTAERVRAKYLLPYIEKLNQQVNDFMNRAASLSTSERRQMENLKKTLEECNEYHDRLQVLAEDTERTSFDLDDGVVVNYAKYGDVLAKLK